jgi:hypothetical protein
VTFKNDTGKDESVYNYFLRQYGYTISNPDLPCLHVGNPKATNYIPLERLRLKAQVNKPAVNFKKCERNSSDLMVNVRAKKYDIVVKEFWYLR